MAHPPPPVNLPPTAFPQNSPPSLWSVRAKDPSLVCPFAASACGQLGGFLRASPTLASGFLIFLGPGRRSSDHCTPAVEQSAAWTRPSYGSKEPKDANHSLLLMPALLFHFIALFVTRTADAYSVVTRAIPAPPATFPSRFPLQPIACLGPPLAA